MQYSVNVNRQVEWYASQCWFSRFAQTDKFMKHGCNNRAQAKARVSHLVAAIWDLKKKKDFLVDTLQKATYPYVIEKTMPAKLMQVYNAYAHDVQGSTYREMVQKETSICITNARCFHLTVAFLLIIWETDVSLAVHEHNWKTQLFKNELRKWKGLPPLNFTGSGTVYLQVGYRKDQV